ncbi:hypothetical protein HDU96_004453 [Phlyctochytrium bullatum]|nr:hypothetical protein HDU96_004453 [Phlyctochytrium bullatum]
MSLPTLHRALSSAMSQFVQDETQSSSGESIQRLWPCSEEREEKGELNDTFKNIAEKEHRCQRSKLLVEENLGTPLTAIVANAEDKVIVGGLNTIFCVKVLKDGKLDQKAGISNSFKVGESGKQIVQSEAASPDQNHYVWIDHLNLFNGKIVASVSVIGTGKENNIIGGVAAMTGDLKVDTATSLLPLEENTLSLCSTTVGDKLLIPMTKAETGETGNDDARMPLNLKSTQLHTINEKKQSTSNAAEVDPNEKNQSTSNDPDVISHISNAEKYKPNQDQSERYYYAVIRKKQLSDIFDTIEIRKVNESAKEPTILLILNEVDVALTVSRLLMIENGGKYVLLIAVGMEDGHVRLLKKSLEGTDASYDNIYTFQMVDKGPLYPIKSLQLVKFGKFVILAAYSEIGAIQLHYLVANDVYEATSAIKRAEHVSTRFTSFGDQRHGTSFVITRVGDNKLRLWAVSLDGHLRVWEECPPDLEMASSEADKKGKEPMHSATGNTSASGSNAADSRLSSPKAPSSEANNKGKASVLSATRNTTASGTNAEEPRLSGPKMPNSGSNNKGKASVLSATGNTSASGSNTDELRSSGVKMPSSEPNNNGKAPVHQRSTAASASAFESRHEDTSAPRGREITSNWLFKYVRDENLDEPKLAKLLLLGAKIDSKQNGMTPLHVAAGGGSFKVVELLLAKKANKDIQDDEGKTPLHVAAGGGYFDVVELLLAKKANKDIRDDEGKTPLHWAALSGNVQCIELLLNKGANTEIEDEDGKTPSQLATDGRCREAFQKWQKKAQESRRPIPSRP